VPRLIAVYPVSDEDINALPVKALDPAVAFYQDVLGFSVTRREGSAAILVRDELQIGLIVKSDHEPRQAGSIAFEVDDLDAMHGALQHAGGQPGTFGIDEWWGRSHRTFFLREEENGYCYCFYHPIPSD
jgi:catechol 2,3-dioxygenase-like lactoylglutathione lyase family enzyme